MYLFTKMPGESSTLWGMNGGQPESPDGKYLVYTQKKSLQEPETQICICDRDTLENQRVLFTVSCMNHNSASASWIDSDLIVFRDTVDSLPAFRILNVHTGQVKYGPVFAKESHCAENGKYPFSVSKEFLDRNPGYPQISQCGIYTLDVRAGTVELVVTEEQIIGMVTSHGCTARENTAAVSHVQLNPSATSVMMRLSVPECPVFGALGCVDLMTGATYLIKDKPVHQLWFDDDTYMATRQFYDGQKIEMDSAYIARFSKSGKELEVLGGIGNHIDGAAGRGYFTGDRAYPGYQPNVFLYRRGEKTPLAEFDVPDEQETVWKLQVHPNPTFSRDGKRIYFNRPEAGGITKAGFVDITELV